MPDTLTAAECSRVVIEIGGVPIRLCVDDSGFIDLLSERYAGFVSNSLEPRFEFQIDFASPGYIEDDNDVHLRWNSCMWFLDNGEFNAE